MDSSALIAQPLQSEGAFNWVYLTDWIVNGVLCLFFLFYFNRLFATLLLYLARLYLWRSLRVYVDIKALQISPLAGRIFFKGIRYHGENETIFVHGGYVTWRYWLRSVKQCKVFEEPNQNHEAGDETTSDTNQSRSQDQEKGKESKGSSPSTTSPLPCRISVNVYGVEAFLYNRGPAYDWILETVSKAEAANATARRQTETACSFEKKSYVDPKHQSSQDSASTASSPGILHHERPTSDEDKHNRDTLNLRNTASSWSSQNDDRSSYKEEAPDLTPPAFLRFLPIHVQCNKGAAVLGNENTKAIITAKFDNANGEFDASSSGPLDIFKILMNFQVVHPYIQLKPNLDYKKDQLTEASTIKNISSSSTGGSEEKLQSHVRFPGFKVFNPSYWKEKLPPLSLWPRGSSESIAFHHHLHTKYQKLPLITADVPGNSRWLGLTRYLNDEQNDEHDEWSAVEYAKSSVLADIQKVDFGFYWDIAGPVLSRSQTISVQQSGVADEINGSVPPEYGMTLVVHGGQVNYGPWADRHRIILQQLFFPYSYADAVPTEKLKPGQPRLCTVFKLNMRVEDDVILRIPFREPSKDAKWKGRATAVTGRVPEKTSFTKRKGKSKRPFKDSKRRNATQGRDVRPFAWFDIKVASGTTIDYTMDMFPKTMGYTNELVATFNSVDIFSSLNHCLLWRCPEIRMNCDLSNPLAWNGLRTWTFNVDINRLDFYLLRDHTFLLVDMIEDWISGQVQDFFTFAPYRYKLNVHFQDYKLFLNTNDANIIDNADNLDENDFIILYGRTLDADLLIPIDRLAPAENAISFNVLSTNLGFELCMPPKSTLRDLVTENDVAQLESVEVVGAYTYCSEVKAGLTETLYLDITGKHLNVAFFGWLGRHFANIKENYFGDMVHFRTLDEFQDLVGRNFQDIDSEHPPVKSNDLDVLLDIRAEDVNIQLPSGLYSSEEHIRVRVDSTDVDLRVNNYYLELMVNSSPLELTYTARTTSQDLQPAFESPETQLFIDGVKVFGHRLFGIAPSEPPYVSNWDVDAGNIMGECTVPFLEKFVGAAQSFALGLPDAENAVPLPGYPELHDSTFVRFACPEIRIWCLLEQAACLLFTENADGSFHDLAGEIFSQQLNMVVPNLTVACLDTEHFFRHKSHASRIAHTTAYLKTTLFMSMVQRNLQFEKQRRLQQDHITFHDSKRGNRVPFMHAPYERHRDHLGGEIISLDLPSLPPPIRSLHNASSNLQQQSLNQVLPPKPNDVEARDAQEAAFHGSLTKHTPHLSHSIAFPSPYKAPYFPLLDMQPDLSNVPAEPSSTSSKSANEKFHSFGDNEEVDDPLGEDTIHTSFMINLDPSVRIFCTPEAVRSVSHIVEQIQPKHPEQILDGFHFKTITEVLASYTRKRGNNSLTDLCFNIPYLHLRFHSDHMPQWKASVSSTFDRYNMIADDFNVSVRIKTVPSRKNESDANSLHATLKSLRVTAQEGTESDTPDDAALKMVVNDTLVWLVDSDRMSIHTSFYNTEITTVSKKVEYLATLIHRTTMLVDEFRARFEEILEIQHQRLQYLIFSLLHSGYDNQDPSFLTRPSYVIRSSPDHIRNSDSWKIISRLHYNYLRLTQNQRVQLARNCFDNYKTLPPNAEDEVLSKLNSWLSWDAAHVKEAFAVRIIYGTLADIEKLHDRSKTPLALSFRSANLRVVVDPGQEQTELSLDQVAVGLAITPPPPPSALQIFQDYNPIKTTVVQVKVGNFSLRVNWSICKLIDHVLELFKQQAPQDSDIVLQRKETVASRIEEQEKVHIVVSADSSSIYAKAPNVSLSIRSLGPKISITGIGWNGASRKTAFNLLLAATETNLQLDGRSRNLLETDIVAPTFFVDYSKEIQNEKPDEALKLAGDSREIKFQINEEIPGLIETVNDLVAEEAAYIFELIQRQESVKPAFPSSELEKPLRDSAFRISVTLFLNDYTISIALFNDLVYVVSGRDVRLSVLPEQNPSTKYQVDYDLKAHTHKLLGHQSNVPYAPPSLHVPSINGTMQLDIQNQSVHAVGLLTVEKILLDGFAVYGFLSAFAPSKIQSAVDAIESDTKSLKQKIEESFLLPGSRSKPKSPSQKAAKFSVGMVFAGLAISADAPATPREQRPSNVLFDVRSIHLRTSNLSKVEDAPLNFPEIQASVQEISLELRHLERDALRSCGKLALSSHFSCSIDQKHDQETRNFKLLVTGPDIEVNAETAPLLVEVITHAQDRIKALDLSRERKYLKKLRNIERKPNTDRQAISIANRNELHEENQKGPTGKTVAVQSTFSFELRTLRIGYFVESSLFRPMAKIPEDLVLTIDSIRLLARNQDDAQLRLEKLQLALVPQNWETDERPYNSALMPEIIFNVVHTSTPQERNIIFKAAGKALDLQLDPGFVLPASDLEKSLTLSSENTRVAAEHLRVIPSSGGFDKRKLLGEKALASFTTDLNFAGAVVRLQSFARGDTRRTTAANLRSQKGRYGQFSNETSKNAATLRAPGTAIKVLYEDDRTKQPSLNIEVKVDGSNNTLQPTVVPLILQVSDSVKKVIRERDDNDKKPQPVESDKSTTQQFLVGESIVQTDPRAVLGRTRLNLGVRICRQEFSLTCQPIAKVSAYAKLDDIYITANNVDSEETGHFFAASAAFKGLKVSLQHMYSREATFGLDIHSIVLSIMNSKHISGTSGISAILNINPTSMQINAKQLQDLLLFREIWLPPEIRTTSIQRRAAMAQAPQEYFVQRYQQVAAATAFPWNATVAIEELKVDIDLGQSIGKTSFKIGKLWAHSKKTTRARQNLCVGIGEVSASSSGRMSGFVELEKMKVRTSIAWPLGHEVSHTPLIQGSVGFDRLKVKVAFDYQAFAVADISSFEFIMYNVRDPKGKAADRLVAILDGEKVNAYCISASAALGLSLVQAFERLVQEKQVAYDQALKDIEKFLRRRSSLIPARTATKEAPAPEAEHLEKELTRCPLSLQTDVVVTLRSLDVGAFPGTLLDRQVLKGEASDVQARFAVVLEHGKIHSGLGLTLGQLRVALAPVSTSSIPKTLGEIAVDEVVKNATSAKGGIILRVPKVVATMQTWQAQDSNVIDYIFKSSFEGKIDVGWNYSRISFIRGMWATHERNFAARLGKPLPESAVKITGAPKALPEGDVAPPEALSDTALGTTISTEENRPQQKITAEVSLPQSKYIYRAREPPIIETPQLRDMGEATPPLEWVGLHRDRLPNLTHQIVIVTLLEIAKEVEDAYSGILGSA